MAASRSKIFVEAERLSKGNCILAQSPHIKDLLGMDDAHAKRFIAQGTGMRRIKIYDVISSSILDG